jgi:hypothetical protein
MDLKNSNIVQICTVCGVTLGFFMGGLTVYHYWSEHTTAALKQENTELQKNLSLRINTISKLKKLCDPEHMRDCVSSLEGAGKEVIQKDSEIAQLKKSNESLLTSNQSYETRVKGLEQQLTQKTSSEVLALKKSTEAEIRQKDESINELKGQLSKLKEVEKRVTQKDSEILQIKVQNQSLLERIQTTETKAKDLEQRLKQKNAEAEAARKKLETETSGYQDKIKQQAQKISYIRDELIRSDDETMPPPVLNGIFSFRVIKYWTSGDKAYFQIMITNLDKVEDLTIKAPVGLLYPCYLIDANGARYPVKFIRFGNAVGSENVAQRLAQYSPVVAELTFPYVAEVRTPVTVQLYCREKSTDALIAVSIKNIPLGSSHP